MPLIHVNVLSVEVSFGYFIFAVCSSLFCNLQAGPDESLADVASRIRQNNISAIPVVHSVNGLCPRLLHIACLSGVLKRMFWEVSQNFILLLICFALTDAYILTTTVILKF